MTRPRYSFYTGGYAAGRRHALLLAAVEAVKDGQVVLWASPTVPVILTESLITNARQDPARVGLSRLYRREDVLI